MKRIKNVALVRIKEDFQLHSKFEISPRRLAGPALGHSTNPATSVIYHVVDGTKINARSDRSPTPIKDVELEINFVLARRTAIQKAIRPWPMAKQIP